MSKKEKNKKIIVEVRNRLAKAGISDRLEVFPVENTFTKRPRYWNNGETNLFKIHMWDLNSLDDEDCSAEIDQRISAARKYFKM